MNRRFFILAGIVVATIFLFIFGLIKNSDRGVGTGEEYSPSNGAAIMNESDELYRNIDNAKQFDALRNDLGVFGRKAFEKYQSGKEKDVVFIVKNAPQKDGETVRFEGVYGISKDRITVALTKLQNNKIRVSVTNQKTSLNIDQELPSNSARNQYIGSLPIKTAVFSLAYIESTDSFFATILSGDVAAGQNAVIAELQRGLQIDSLGDESISFVSIDANDNIRSVPSPTPSADDDEHWDE